MRKTRNLVFALSSLALFNTGWAAQSTVLAIDLGLDSTEMQNALSIASSIANSADSTDLIGLVSADDIVRHIIEPGPANEFIIKLEEIAPQLKRSEISNFAIGLERSLAMAKDQISEKRIVLIGNSTINSSDQTSDNRYSQWGNLILIPDIARQDIQLILILTDTDAGADLINATVNASTANTYYKLPSDEESVLALVQTLTDETLLASQASAQEIKDQTPLVEAATEVAATEDAGEETIIVAESAITKSDETVQIAQQTQTDEDLTTAIASDNPVAEETTAKEDSDATGQVIQPTTLLNQSTDLLSENQVLIDSPTLIKEQVQISDSANEVAASEVAATEVAGSEGAIDETIIVAESPIAQPDETVQIAQQTQTDEDLTTAIALDNPVADETMAQDDSDATGQVIQPTTQLDQSTDALPENEVLTNSTTLTTENALIEPHTSEKTNVVSANNTEAIEQPLEIEELVTNSTIIASSVVPVVNSNTDTQSVSVELAVDPDPTVQNSTINQTVSSASVEPITEVDIEATDPAIQIPAKLEQPAVSPAENEASSNSTSNGRQNVSTDPISDNGSVSAIDGSSTPDTIIDRSKTFILLLALLAAVGTGLAIFFRRSMRKQKDQQDINTNRKLSTPLYRDRIGVANEEDSGISPVVHPDHDNETVAYTDNIPEERAATIPPDTRSSGGNISDDSPTKISAYEDETVANSPDDLTVTVSPDSSAQDTILSNDFPANGFDGSEFSSTQEPEDEFDAFEKSIIAKKKKEPTN